MEPAQLESWERRWENYMREMSLDADPAHDLAHTKRVVATARRLARASGARLEIVLPAAWLHDCVVLPKSDPRRSAASRLASERAAELLREAGYREALIDPIEHAIVAHSFSAGVEPETVEARVVQDADRLDALGAVGTARCFTVGGALGRTLCHPDEIFPATRPVDDGTYTVDHFFAKLLTLAESMQTEAGREEGRRRAEFMHQFLVQFRSECAPSGGAGGLPGTGTA